MITSNQNPKIQKIRNLQQKSKERSNSGLFVADGVRLVEEAVAAGWSIEYVFYSENLSDRGLSIIENLKEKNVDVDEIPFSLMKKISETDHPQGIIAVIKQTNMPLPADLNFILICDAIQDPGNLGTIFRTADAANVQAVLVAPKSADIYSPKVIRSGMGAHFHLPIRQVDWEKINEICKLPTNPLNVYVANANALLSCWEADLRQPYALVVGSEAHGPGQEALQLADHAIKIPMPGNSESLNAAIATSIIIFETIRQRLT